METSLNSEIKNSLNICECVEEEFDLKKIDLRTVSPLTLAYIGDSIYDLIIRTLIVKQGNAPVNKLHKKSSNLVKANSQMLMYEAIKDILSDSEQAIFKRGRNAKSYTSAKNASKSDYRVATGFEALLGYLYLDNKMDRVFYLVKYGLEKSELDYK